MRPLALKTLTWGTVAGSVACALWLAAAAGEPGFGSATAAAAPGTDPALQPGTDKHDPRKRQPGTPERGR